MSGKMYKPLKADSQSPATGKERSALFQEMLKAHNHQEESLDGEPLEEEEGEYHSDDDISPPPKKKTKAVIPRNFGVQSYQLHLDIKHKIADVLEEIRQESKRKPNLHVQVRNRTCASITKRYLYERDEKKALQCLEDAKKLLQKYRGS
ncbi:33 K protein [Barthadenovirus sternae]|nr:33 K protein [Tern atadenovirus 1]